MDILTRDNIDEKYKWDLSKLFINDEEWEKSFKIVSREYQGVVHYKGQLNNADDIFKCFKNNEAISRKLHNLYTYAKMKLDEDAKNSIHQMQVRKIEMLLIQYSELASFITPEISSLTKSNLEEIANNKLLVDYKYYFKKLINNKEHILTDSEEKILAGVGSFSSDFETAFSMFNDSDIQFKKIKDKNGELVNITHGSYSKYLSDKDQNVRRRAFKSMFDSYKSMNDTISILYAGNVKSDCFYAKVRKYDSAIQLSLMLEDVSPMVYKNLIKSIHDSLYLLHDYFALRKEILKLDNMHMYDLHVPIFDTDGLCVSYEEAQEIVLEALKPLGDEYQKLLKTAFNNRWIDVYETAGKRSGAYSWGTYDSLPYVLLNYYSNTHDVFTIAHELGHSMHSYYSHKNQPYATAQYEIFVAEVASTVNEVLLLKHLIKTTKDKTFKQYLLSYYLDMFRTTLFRQTQFAEFEKSAHEMHEKGEPLTSESLNKLYFKLNKRYYGKNVVSDPLIQYEWSRIPHFYNSFYVYKYATGITSAVIIANGILSGDKDKLNNYYKFLSLGGSMSPVDILQVAGVDLLKESTFKIAMAEFKETLDMLRSEVNNG